MRIRDLMTDNVITISPHASIKEAAGRMVEAAVSGLVVVDNDGTAIGIVTEADFVLGEAYPDKRRASLLRWLGTSRDRSSPATSVGEIMTEKLVTIGPDASHRAAARLMSKKGVKRLPVVDDGRLVGIVSRADIVRAFDRSDSEIQAEIIDELIPHVLWIDPKRLTVTCDDGIVFLRGQLASRVDAELVEHMAQKVDGVVDVRASLTWEFDPDEHKSRSLLANRS